MDVRAAEDRILRSGPARGGVLTPRAGARPGRLRPFRPGSAC